MVGINPLPELSVDDVTRWAARSVADDSVYQHDNHAAADVSPVLQ